MAAVIATYNRWPVLGDAINSALNQTMPFDEIVVVDDGSTDGTASHVPAIFPQVRLLSIANSERGAARNHGARSLDAEWLCFLDSDDVLEPWHVEQLQAALDTQTPGVIAAPAAVWDPVTDHQRPVPMPARPEDVRDACLRGMVVPLQGLFARRENFEAVDGFPERRNVAGSEDWVLLVRLARRYDLGFLPHVSARVRDHAGRSMANPDSIIASRQDALTLLVEEGDAGTGTWNEEDLHRLRAGYHRFAAAHLYEAGRMAEARSELRRARTIYEESRFDRLWLQTWFGSTLSRGLRSVKRRVGSWHRT